MDGWMAASFFSGDTTQKKDSVAVEICLPKWRDASKCRAGVFLILKKEIVVILKDYCEQSLKVNRGSSALQQELTA